MTPLLTVNLLRVLFLTFCTAIGGIVTSEIQGSPRPGIPKPTLPGGDAEHCGGPATQRRIG